MVAAVAVEPVKATPARAGCVSATAPKAGPSAGVSCSAACGIPPRAAGASSHVRPAVSPGRAWPPPGCRPERGGDLPGEDRQREVQGLMQTNTPRPCSVSVLRSPVGPGSTCGCAEQLAAARRVVAAEVHRLAQLRDGIGQGLAGLAHQQAQVLAAARLEQLGRPLQACGPLAAGVASQAGCAAAASAMAWRDLGAVASRVRPTTRGYRPGK